MRITITLAAIAVVLNAAHPAAAQSSKPRSSTDIRGRTAPSAAGSSARSAPREQTADQQVQHVLNRLAFGPRPGDAQAVRAMGVDKWIALQLEPERIADTATERFLAQFKTLGMTGN